MNTAFIELLSDVRLSPVIELEPASFGSCEIRGSEEWTAERSSAHWKTCLAESGILNLEPIELGSWLVSVHNIASPWPLLKIIERHLDGTDASATAEEFLPFSGGFVLYHGAEPILYPGCCGDLGDLEGWRTTLDERAETPTMLWVGHPWFSYWFEGRDVFIREGQEYPTSKIPRTVRLSAETLQTAIMWAERELDDFLPRVLAALSKMPQLTRLDELGARLIGRFREEPTRESPLLPPRSHGTILDDSASGDDVETR